MGSRSATGTSGPTRRTESRSAEGPVRSDPFQILGAEHELLRAQIRRTIEAATTQSPTKSAAIATLDAAVRRHMTREDLALYPVCERLFGTTGAVSVLRTDHVAIEGTLAELTSPSARLLDHLRGLARLLEDHLAREEHVLFPMTAALLSGVEMDRLAWQLRTGPAARGAVTR